DRILDRALSDPSFRQEFIFGARSIMPAQDIFKGLLVEQQKLEKIAKTAKPEQKKAIDERQAKLKEIALAMVVEGIITADELNSIKEDFKKIVLPKDIITKLMNLESPTKRDRAIVLLQKIYEPNEMVDMEVLKEAVPPKPSEKELDTVAIF